MDRDLLTKKEQGTSSLIVRENIVYTYQNSAYLVYLGRVQNMAKKV